MSFAMILVMAVTVVMGDVFSRGVAKKDLDHEFCYDPGHGCDCGHELVNEPL